MIRRGVSIAVVVRTYHMLENRNIMMTKGNNTRRRIIDSGCPQGGVLSPLLWSLVMDALLHLLIDRGCHPIGYADDILNIVHRMHLDAFIKELVHKNRRLIIRDLADTIGISRG